MSGSATESWRLHVRLTADLRAIIEEAATRTGRTVSDFVASTLAEKAHEVNAQWRQLDLSIRDWALFHTALEDATAEPNEVLKQAAERYRVSRVAAGSRQRDP